MLPWVVIGFVAWFLLRSKGADAGRNSDFETVRAVIASWPEGEDYWFLFSMKPYPRVVVAYPIDREADARAYLSDIGLQPGESFLLVSKHGGFVASRGKP